MFDTVLIANRGEIACRVIRTCRRLGIRAVAVYSDADAAALHVAQADEAHRIGPAPARRSYLDIEAILAAAKAAGAEAIHPGYGFLAENAEFAEACAGAGVAFVGPSAAAIRALGAKDAAKKVMDETGVPVVPGYHGGAQDLETLRGAALELGFPVLVKPVAGGGGLGMRVAAKAKDLADAVAASRREAASAFGDDRVLIEKHLSRPRHVEVQIFADGSGQTLHLFERDCSIQRRYQKVMEEAPAPGLEADLRARMAAAAVAAARAIGYVGAGTVEFLLDRKGGFYFLEMNTRLQVEHPVTEMVTGQDLVEWQLEVAAGAALPLAQEAIALSGHAIEARLYAEDPERDFLPASGRIARLRLPREDGHVRIDTGVREGDAVAVHYDPMIAKLIVWDRDRAGAVRRLRTALGEVQVLGVATNAAFLASLAAQPAFAAGELDTGFVSRHRKALLPARRAASDRVLALAALAVLCERADAARAAAARSNDPYSPWHRTDGWQLNDDNRQEVAFRDGETIEEVTVRARGDGYLLQLRNTSLQARAERDASGDLTADLDGVRVKATVLFQGSDLLVTSGAKSHRLTLYDPVAEAETQETAPGALTVPLPGTITAVMVAPGDAVKRGTPLVALEAMKMEHVILADADGVVEAVHVGVGDQVEDGVEVLAFKPAAKK